MKGALPAWIFFSGLCAFLVAAQSPAKSQAKPSAPASADSSAAAGHASLQKARDFFKASKYDEAEAELSRLLKQNDQSPAAEEANVLLTDIYLRQSKPEPAQAVITRFRRAFPGSAFSARMLYYQGLAHLRLGNNSEAARAFVASAATAGDTGTYHGDARGLKSLLESAEPDAGEFTAALESLEGDPKLRAELMEKLGDELLRRQKFQAARGVFEAWLDKFASFEGADRIQGKLKQAVAAAPQNKTLMIMAPFSGEFADIGRSLKEGVLLAVEESNAKSGGQTRTLLLDDQGSLITGIQRLRKAMREEKFDAVVGPAMSDVSAAVAADLSARSSKIAMITPTATTDGIAALGPGVFQINVTTGTLGQKIASYAVACLKLKTFAVLAPQSEYGHQLAEAFANTVEKNGGTVLATQFYEPDANDMGPQFREIRKEAARLYLEKQKADGIAVEDPKTVATDSVLSVDGLFLAAANGEEAYKLASQASFNKLKAQFLGSSGWNDKSMLHQGSTAPLGAYFSVDFQENQRAEGWLAFQNAYAARWKRQPDKVAALAYDAARLALQGLAGVSADHQLIPNLQAIKSFNGVMGRIVFDEKSGANRNAAVYLVEKKGFKEVEACPEAE